jgi:glycosyltransferase involved in cell wall biosynthesis
MKLSIALATCNGERFLREQLDSYRAQARLPDEVVVCDDRSDDRTMEILSEFRARAPFPVRIHRNDPRLGITRNFERVIGLCDGDVIFLSDQDDVWAPEKLARHEAVYRACPDVGLVFSNAQVVDEAGTPLGYTLFDSFAVGPSRRRAMDAGRALEQLVKCSRITGCTMSFRAAHRDAIIPFSGRCPHDEWIALIMSALVRVRVLAECLLRYRRHQAQAIGAHVPGRGDRRLRPSWLPARSVHIDRQLEQFSEVLDRLSRFEPRWLRRDYGGVVRSKLDYLRRRQSLPRLRLARLPGVTREVITGNYYRYGQWPKLELVADLYER